MKIKDRVAELRRVPVEQLRPHPHNWRTHPPAQRDALRAVLSEIGYADALLAFELPDGSLQLIDGHLRAEAAPGSVAPVLVLDVDAAEAEKLLLTLDPLANMAGADALAWDRLASRIEFESTSITALLDEATARQKASDFVVGSPGRAEPPLPEVYQVVVDCDDESAQAALYKRLIEEGRRCRVLTL